LALEINNKTRFKDTNPLQFSNDVFERSLAPILHYHFIQQKRYDRITGNSSFIHTHICDVCKSYGQENAKTVGQI